MSAPVPEIATYELRPAGARSHSAPQWIAKYISDGDSLLQPTFEGSSEVEALRAAHYFWLREQGAPARKLRKGVLIAACVLTAATLGLAIVASVAISLGLVVLPK